MVSIRTIDEQLKQAGHPIGAWGRSEVKELCNILLPGEIITDCVNGHYFNGFALLCATNQRIILVDVKPMFMTVEDIRYDMIAEIDYSHRLLDSSIKIFTPTKKLDFTSWSITRLRRLAMDSQKHVLAIRQFQASHTQAYNQTYHSNIPTQQQPPIYQQKIEPEIVEYEVERPSLTDKGYSPVHEETYPVMSKCSVNNLSLASLAVNNSIKDEKNISQNFSQAISSSGMGNMSSYPANPFTTNSFRSRNRSWPRSSIITRR